MANVLLATDADYLFDEIDAALGGTYRMYRVHAGTDVLPAVQEVDPVLVLLDLQIGNMGGMATCLDLRLEERAGRIEARKVMMLLDREADIFLAKQGEADGWMIKPLDPFRLRRAVQTVLEEGTYTEGLPEDETKDAPEAEPEAAPAG